MNHWKAITALLLMLLYLPATSHCMLEDAGLIHRSDCCSSGHENGQGHDAADGNCQFETGSFHVPQPGPLLLKLLFDLPAFSPALAGLSASEGPRNLAFPSATSPPDIPCGWQFSHRAALPVRAPSLNS